MKPRVRWWVVIGAILAAWVLTCFGPKADLEAQTVASDSITLRKLAEFRASDNFEVVACLAVRREVHTVFVIDSITGYREGPPCPQGSTGMAANAAADMPQEIAEMIGQMLLAEYPDWIIACAIHSTKAVTFPDGATLQVPVVWCAYRSES